MATITIETRDDMNITVGRTPLNVSDIEEAPEGSFALYVQGLTIEEAGEITRIIWNASDEAAKIRERNTNQEPPLTPTARWQ